MILEELFGCGVVFDGFFDFVEAGSYVLDMDGELDEEVVVAWVLVAHCLGCLMQLRLWLQLGAV